MNRIILIFVSLLVTTPLLAQSNEWENPTVYERHKEAPHAWFKTSHVKSLDGMWKFRYDNDIKESPSHFFATDIDDSKWKRIPVPSNWELQGYGTPIFINIKYMWTPNPPYIDIPNPVGTYRTIFTVPSDWKDREIILHFGSITGYARVYVNGMEAGMTKCAKTPAEFDISHLLKSGKNQLAVQVYRWHEGSYMEDQDFWRITGIERDVYLQAYQQQCIWDYDLKAMPTDNYKNGDFCARVMIRNFAKYSSSGPLQLILQNKEGNEVYHQMQSTDDADKDGYVSFYTKLKNVKLWSAETPYLYRCSMILNGDTVRQDVGFREIKIENARLKVNGKVIYVKGVNRHETNDSLGHVPTKEIMMHDLKLLKSLNINAVRCCHYPNDPLWLQLCDQYGIYLIDEANIETHGMGSVPYFKDTIPHPAYRPEWAPVHVDRIHRMFYRDRNHPSVIGWSLGNECGNGQVFHDQYSWLKRNDTTRFVQFEQAWEDWNTDVVALMYPNWGRIKSYATSGKTRPFIMCEYAHSQGNGTGNFQEFWDLIKSAPNLQGGFIWDFQDQGFKRKINENTDHRTYYMYNGGMGSYVWPDDEDSGTDGIIASDGTPKPGAWEVKKVYQNITFPHFDWDKGELTVKNEYNFTALDGFNFVWTLNKDGQKLTEGTFSLNTAPEKLTHVKLKLPHLDEEGEYTLQVYAYLKRATELLPAHEEMAKEQFVKSGNWYERAQRQRVSGDLQVKDSADVVMFSCNQIHGIISKKDGKIHSYSISGISPFLNNQYPEPYFWRAPNDNDFGNQMPQRCNLWRTLQVNMSVKSCTIGNKTDEGIPVDFILTLRDINQDYQLSYLIRNDGSIKVTARMNTTDIKLPEMPRFGMRMALAKGYENVAYYGRGPIENYADRKTNTFVGQYQTTVADMYYPYIRPQQTGNHTDIRWASIACPTTGVALHISACQPMDFSALHYMDEDFDPGLTRKMQHTKDLLARRETYVIIGDVQRGLGGDNSWGEFPHIQYRHFDGNYEFSYILSLAKGDARIQ